MEESEVREKRMLLFSTLESGVSLSPRPKHMNVTYIYLGTQHGIYNALATMRMYSHP